MLVWGAVGLLVAAAVVEWLVWNIRRIRRGVPGYWGWPVFYSLPAIIGHIYRDDLLQDLLKLAADKKYSWNFRAPGYGDVVVSGKPDDVAWILQGNFENYPKYEAISDLAQELVGSSFLVVCDSHPSSLAAASLQSMGTSGSCSGAWPATRFACATSNKA